MLLKKKNVDMTQGPIWQRLSSYAVPLIIGELFQLLYTLVDSMIVGNFVGPSALAAIGASETIVKVLVGFFNGMAVGFTVIIARWFGARDREKMDRSVNGVLQLGFFMGLIITVLGLLLSRTILRLVQTPLEVLPEAAVYLNVYFAGILGFTLYHSAASVLHGVGEVRVPLYCLFISSAVNVLLDLLLVLAFDMGVVGVAAATVASQCLAAVISLRALIVRRHLFTISVRRYPLDRKTAWLFLRMGLPTGFQKTITSISNVLVLSRIAHFGQACLAGWTVYNRVDHILSIVAQSLGSALSTFVSQNLGARRFRRIEKGVRQTLAGGTVIFVLLSAMLILIRRPVVRAFGSDLDMRYYAEGFIFYITLFKLTQLLMNVYAATLRGSGHMTLVTVIMLSGIVAFRQLYLLVITAVTDSPWAVGLSYPAGWTFAGLILLAVYLIRVRPGWRAEKEGIEL